MTDREVIIVGAGPSGAAAGVAFAKRGHDVLLLDREQFPRDKPCGDGIPASAIDRLIAMGMRERVLDEDFYRIDRLLLSSPRSYVLEAELHPGELGGHSYVIPRMRFDALIQQYAVDCGVEFQQGNVLGPIIEDGSVVGVKARINGSTQEIRSKIVIGADGVTSTIARKLRQDKHEDKHRAVALRAYISNIDILPNQVEFYLYKGILPGYAWIFPLGDGQANIGLGMRLDKFRNRERTLEEMLDQFMEAPEIKDRLHNGGNLENIAVWQLNFGSQDCQRAYNGAMLVGDAAGLINPLTGGGISNGLQSAILAARIGSNAIREGDTSLKTLMHYNEQLDEHLHNGMRRSYFIQRSLLYFPVWSDLLIRFGGSNSELAQTFVDKL